MHCFHGPHTFNALWSSSHNHPRAAFLGWQFLRVIRTASSVDLSQPESQEAARSLCLVKADLHYSSRSSVSAEGSSASFLKHSGNKCHIGRAFRCCQEPPRMFSRAALRSAYGCSVGGGVAWMGVTACCPLHQRFKCPSLRLHDAMSGVLVIVCRQVQPVHAGK